MPKIEISKSIKVNSKIDEVFSKLNDFSHWTAWSPWIITEPETKVTVGDDKKYYHWSGNRTGEGEMKIINEKENESIDIDLTFIKPWKSTANVGLKLKSVGDETEVTWTMNSSLPFFMFWMKKMMTAFIGMDYERGLRLLKDYVEDGEVHSKLGMKGMTEFAGCNYVGIKQTAAFENMGKSMEGSFQKLHAYVQENGDNVEGFPFSIYHKWEPVKRQTTYTACIPVKEIPANLPAGMVSGSLPKAKVHTVSHTGPYHHIGNAWSTQYNMQRAKEFKLNKKLDPMEIYHNQPTEVDEKELYAEIHMAVQ